MGDEFITPCLGGFIINAIKILISVLKIHPHYHKKPTDPFQKKTTPVCLWAVTTPRRSVVKPLKPIL